MFLIINSAVRSHFFGSQNGLQSYFMYTCAQICRIFFLYSGTHGCNILRSDMNCNYPSLGYTKIKCPAHVNGRSHDSPRHFKRCFMLEENPLTHLVMDTYRTISGERPTSSHLFSTDCKFRQLSFQPSSKAYDVIFFISTVTLVHQNKKNKIWKRQTQGTRDCVRSGRFSVFTPVLQSSIKRNNHDNSPHGQKQLSRSRWLILNSESVPSFQIPTNNFFSFHRKHATFSSSEGKITRNKIPKIHEATAWHL